MGAAVGPVEMVVGPVDIVVGPVGTVVGVGAIVEVFVVTSSNSVSNS